MFLRFFVESPDCDFLDFWRGRLSLDVRTAVTWRVLETA